MITNKYQISVPDDIFKALEVIFNSLIAGAMLFVYFYINPANKEIIRSLDKEEIILFLLIGLPLGLIIHELIHALTAVISKASRWQDIKFSMNIKKFYAAVYFKMLMPIGQFRIVAIMPFLILGLGSFIFATIEANILYLIFSIGMVLFSSSDLVVIYSLRGLTKKAMIQDHPTKNDYIIFSREIEAMKLERIGRKKVKTLSKFLLSIVLGGGILFLFYMLKIK